MPAPGATVPTLAGAGHVSARDASSRIREIFDAEERAGLALAARARVVVLSAVGLLLLLTERPPELYYYEAAIVCLVGLGLAHHALAARSARKWVGFVFVVLDAAALVATLVVVTVLTREGWSPQLALRTAPAAYLFLLVAYVAMSYSPALMLWAGVAAAAVWGLGVSWVALQPGTVIGPLHTASDANRSLHLDPGFIDLPYQLQQAALLLLCAAVLALVVRRSRMLVIRQANAARERANLARYFSPNVVDELAGRDEPLGPGRRQEVAVVFTDIVGFTAMAELHAPERVLEILRAFHARMEALVFAHHGTLEKFIGDALLATFGVPRSRGGDATDALACCHAMLASVEQWNVERSVRGEAPIRIGIGCHYGPVVLGDIGSERNMAFAAVGDTINTASRLQGLTRTIGCDLVVSEAAVRAVRREARRSDDLLETLEPGGLQSVRGRGESIAIYVGGLQLSAPVASGTQVVQQADVV